MHVTSCMKKSTTRRIRKAAKTATKSLRKTARSLGGVEAALTIGTVAIGAALHPEVRARTKDLALAALDRLQASIGLAPPQPSDRLDHESAH